MPVPRNSPRRSGGSASAKAALLETLGAVGGKKALQAIGIAMKEGDPELEDIGSRGARTVDEHRRRAGLAGASEELAR